MSSANISIRSVCCPCISQETISSPRNQCTQEAILVGQTTLKTGAGVISNIPIAAHVFRRLDQQVLPFVERYAAQKGYFDTLRISLRAATGAISSLQGLVDFHYFINKKYLADSWERMIGRVPMMAANIGRGLVWFQEIGFFQLSEMANYLGNVRFFGWVPELISSIGILENFKTLNRLASGLGEVRLFSFVTKLSIGSVIGCAASLAYFCFAIDAAQRLLAPGNEAQRNYAALQLWTYLSELSLEVAVVAGATNLVALGILGVSCITFGIASMAYEIVNEKEIKAAIKV